VNERAGGRSWLILTDGFLRERNAKTAHGVIRYSRDPIAAVLDPQHAGQDLADVMPELGRDAPIVASIAEALPNKPTALLLGVATPGGWMPDHWRAWITEAIEAGLDVVNGLHRFLKDDDEFVKLAELHGTELWDVRDPPGDIPLFTGKILELPRRVVLTVGSDCAVGKKTAAIEIERAGKAAGYSTEFAATGQTGIVIAGRGIAVDRVIADFLAGAAELLVCSSHPSTDVVVVEGQGSLWHPAFSGVTLGLLHGAAPHVLVLCHQAGRDRIEEPPYTLLPPLYEMIHQYEELTSKVRPARIACVALNCQGLSDADARRAKEEVAAETGLYVGDPLAGEAPELWKAVEGVLPRRRQ
jgi:uncharacterized NAD-dependent epimerase/dehydratase family protein